MSDLSVEGDSDFASRWRQVRACARCRRLKMKCMYENPTYKSCKRCFAANVVCSVDEDPTAQFARKKRRKISASLDTRKELEVKLENLRKTVDNLESIMEEVSKTDDGEHVLKPVQSKLNEVNSRIGALQDSGDREHTNVFEEKSRFPPIEYGKNLMRELVYHHKMISKEECEERFNFFINNILQYYPVLCLSKILRDFEYLFENSPILLAGCISVTAMNNNQIQFSSRKDSPLPPNEYTYKFLTYYLERFLSYKIFIKSEDFDYQLIYTCLILSLWSLPSPKLCHYQSHLFLLIGYDISLCINLGESLNLADAKIKRTLSDDDSAERNRLRAFLSVYACCGSLELSLPRFKLITWGKKHDLAYRTLDSINKANPSIEDRYICCFSSVIRIGQEIFEFLSQNNLVNTSTNSRNRPDGTNKSDGSYLNGKQRGIFSLKNIQFVLYNYEKKLEDVLNENEFSRDFVRSDNGSIGSGQKESILLSTVYYQLLIVIYDNLVSSFLFSYSSDPKPTQQNDQLNDMTLLQQVMKLINACNGVLKSFIVLNFSHTINPPTFFYYKAMHALILLIRIRLVILSKKYPSLNVLASSGDIDENIESNFEKVHQILQSKSLNSSNSSRMMMILNNISKWINISNNYKSHLASRDKDDPSDNFVHLMSMTKDQEIENLKVPKDLESRISKSTNVYENSRPNGNQARETGHASIGRMTDFGEVGKDRNQMNSVTGLPSFFQEPSDITIEDIFKEIDTNIFDYLNPIEQSVDNLPFMGYNNGMDFDGDNNSANTTTNNNSYF